jgi:lipid-A-disaccharide synthase
VFYYGAPQLWAWAGWRVKKMRRFVDHVLCKLPFEESWYRERGCNATYVGHPYFDQLRAEQLDENFVAKQRSMPGRLVAILPGSRTQEVKSNLTALLKAARLVREQVPEVRFAVAAFKPAQAEWIKEQLLGSDLPIAVYVKRTPELMSTAECAMAVSGSVSLELLYHKTPSVIVYQVSRLAFFVQRFFRKVRYITLVNLLVTDDLFPRKVSVYDPQDPADAAVLMPEYLSCQDKSPQIAAHVIEWLSTPAVREALVAKMAALKERVGHGGASQRAAEYLFAKLAPPPKAELRTHHQFARQSQQPTRTAA